MGQRHPKKQVGVRHRPISTRPDKLQVGYNSISPWFQKPTGGHDATMQLVTLKDNSTQENKQTKNAINGSRGPTNTHTALQRPTQMPRPTVRRDTALALGHFNWDGPASVKAWHPTQQALSGAAAEKRGKGGSEEAPIMRMLFCISLRARCTRRWRTSTSSR
ncbi:hypothetical protein TcG_05316 [Trypanosoma cruzi]|nr:hypothetical protein TcG_05316 [Trypanosoma cruzi]